jgi:hypothetical protein
MRAAGCVMLSFGAESGSDRVLARMRKGFSAAESAAAITATHEAGIVNRVNLIAGFFGETGEDVADTVLWVRGLKHAIDIIGCFEGFHVFEGMEIDERDMGVRLRPGRDTLLSGPVTVPYDEVGGPGWKEKKVRTEAARMRVLAEIESLGIPHGRHVDEYDLFLLAAAGCDKAEIRRRMGLGPGSAG